VNLNPGVLEIQLSTLNRADFAGAWGEPLAPEHLLAEVDRLRERILQLHTLRRVDTLTCLIINLGASRFEQERYGEALALFDEAQFLARSSWDERQDDDSEAEQRPDRFRTLHAIAEYNRAMVFIERGLPDAGADALGVANDMLSSASPNPLCEGLHVDLSRHIDHALSHV